MPMLAHSDDIAIDNPLGAIRRGADEPHKMYEGVFKSPANVHVVFWDYTIAEDALVVARLKRAGAVIIGKTNIAIFGP